MKSSKLVASLFVALILVSPVMSISLWFTSRFHDLKVTLKRFSECLDGLSPLTSVGKNDTEFLINQMKLFLNETNLDNEQLANVTMLLDHICLPVDSKYPVSIAINVSNYDLKENRCKSIDESLDSMFSVFRKASMNRSEPLDFSSIEFFPHSQNRTGLSYNLTDLINTSWIKSEFIHENICRITNAVKSHVSNLTSSLGPQDRQSLQQANTTGFTANITNYLNDILDRIFGIQRRLYWDSSNTLEVIYSRLNNNIRSSSIFNYLSRGNSTVSNAANNSKSKLNATISTIGNNSTSNLNNNIAVASTITQNVTDGASQLASEVAPSTSTPSPAT